MHPRLYHVETVIMTFQNYKGFSEKDSRYSTNVREFAALLGNVKMMDFPSTRIFDWNMFRSATELDHAHEISSNEVCIGGDFVTNVEDAMFDFMQMLGAAQREFRPEAEKLVCRYWNGSCLTVLTFVH